MAIGVTRTYVGSIQNHRQVCASLDSLGDSPSKIGNVARWTADRIWDETGEIPDEGVLKAYMKNQSCWKDLNAQSSQKVIEDLSHFSDWSLDRLRNRANDPSAEAQDRDIDGIIFENIWENISNGSKFQQWAYAKFVALVEYKVESTPLLVDELFHSCY